MPLFKNTSQPFFADPNSPNFIDCIGDYCNPVASGDFIYQQWYQTPCGSNEIADPEFDNYSVGADQITNGTFTGSAAGWSLGGNWVYGTNNVVCTAGVISELSQTPVGLVADTYYRVTFDLVRSAGSIVVYIDAGAGLVASATLDESGSYLFDLYLPPGPVVDIITFTADADFAGNIDNITMSPVTYSSWVVNPTWTFIDPTATEPGKAFANATGTDLLIENVLDYIVIGDYYSLTFTVSDYSGVGTLTPYIANMPLTAISGNGTYTVYATPTATGVVSFLPSADFRGSVSLPDLRALRNDFLFEVIDEDGNRFDISGYMQYHEIWVTLKSPIFDLLEIPFACYNIEVTDRCLVEGIELVTNGDFAAGYDNWTRNNGFDQYDLNAGVLEFVFEPLEGATRVSNGDFSAGATDWTVGAGWAIGGGAATHTPGNTATLSQIVNTSAPAVAPNVLVHWFQFTISNRTAGSVTLTLSDQTSIAFTTNQIITARLIPTIGGAVTFAFTPSNDFDGDISAIALHEATRPWSDFVIIRNVANPDMVQGNYALEYDLATNTTVQTNGSVGIGIVGMTQSLTYDSVVGIQTRSITNYTPGAQEVYMVARFSQSGVFFPGRIGVDNVSAIRVEPFEATYTSECMDYRAEHENTKLVTGWCDQESFGFEFANTGFKLQMRMVLRSYNPFQQKSKQIYEYGTGDAEITYAEKTKYWQLATDFLSETAHDALGTIIDCDHFVIGTSEANSIEYLAQAEDYTPQWRNEGDYNLSVMIFNLRLKEGGQIFNRHVE